MDGDAVDGVDETAVRAVRAGDTLALSQALTGQPGLATARLPGHGGRTLLHIACDWPGHLPNVAESIAVLVSHGADVEAAFDGANRERPLHWAASADDVDAVDALLDAGADIDTPGAVIGGGTPLNDATAFAQWDAARRLVERGAAVSAWDEAALGLTDDVARMVGQDAHDLDALLWAACHGGHRATAALLLDAGADLNRVGWDDLTPLDAAERAGASDTATWLRSRGALHRGQLGPAG